ncbi:MAG: hypothetical protein WBS14_10025, partial [Rhodomicrobium sp.]
RFLGIKRTAPIAAVIARRSSKVSAQRWLVLKADKAVSLPGMLSDMISLSLIQICRKFHLR